MSTLEYAYVCAYMRAALSLYSFERQLTFEVPMSNGGVGESTASDDRAASPRDVTEDASPDPGALSTQERAQLILEIRMSFHLQRTFIRAICTGIELGAEEVQDERLRASERPPEAGAYTDIALLILFFVLESPFATAIAAGVRRGIIVTLRDLHLVRSRAFARIVLESDEAYDRLRAAKRRAEVKAAKVERRAATTTGTRRKQRAREAQAQAQAAVDELDLALTNFGRGGLATARRRGAEQLRSTRSSLQFWLNEEASEYIVAPFKSYAQVNPRSPAHRAGQQVSPGVSLRSIVEERAMTFELSTYWMQEVFERDASSVDLTIEQAAGLYDDLPAFDVATDLGEVIDVHQFIAAGAIWGGVLGLGEVRSKRLQAQDAARRTSTRFAADPLPTLDPLARLPESLASHKEYLVRRFGQAAEAWARATMGVPGGVVLPGPTGVRPNDHRALEAYLSAGQGKKEGNLLDQISEWLGRAPTSPSDLRLDLVLQYLEALTEQVHL